MNIKKLTKTLLLLFLLVFLAESPNFAQMGTPENNRVINSSISDKEKLELFDDVWKTVNRSYFDEKFNGRDWNKVGEDFRPKALGAKDKYELGDILQDMLNQLKASHLYIWWDNFGLKKKQISNAVQQKFDSKKFELALRFGFRTRKFEDRWLVTKVDTGSNAELQGVQRGWTAISINGHEYPALDTAYKQIENEEADFVFLDEKKQERKLRLVRKFFILPRTDLGRESRILENKVFYVKFANFIPETEKWWKEEVTKNFDAPAMIIDLRENTGGYVDTVKSMLSYFFPKSTPVGEFIERDGDDKILKIGREDYYRGKLIVLTDEASMSGSEIFASTIQEQGRGKIIGAKTPGAVLASVRVDLPLGFKLSLPIRDYKTNNNFRIEGNGVTPDYKVQPTVADFYQNNDPVLVEALKLLSNKQTSIK